MSSLSVFILIIGIATISFGVRRLQNRAVTSRNAIFDAHLQNSQESGSVSLSSKKKPTPAGTYGTPPFVASAIDIELQAHKIDVVPNDDGKLPKPIIGPRTIVYPHNKGPGYNWINVAKPGKGGDGGSTAKSCFNAVLLSDNVRLPPSKVTYLESLPNDELKAAFVCPKKYEPFHPDKIIETTEFKQKKLPIAVGLNFLNQPIIYEAAEDGHNTGIIIGNQGSGKTALLRSIIYSFHFMDNPPWLVLTDIEKQGADLGMFASSRLLYTPLITDIKTANRAYRHISEHVIAERNKSKAEALSSGKTIVHRPIVIVTDELNMMIKRYGDQCKPVFEALEAFGASGRSSGIYSFMGGQVYSRNLLSEELRRTTAIKIHLRGSNESSRNLYGHYPDKRVASLEGKGHLVHPDEFGDLIEGQASYVDDVELKKVIDSKFGRDSSNEYEYSLNSEVGNVIDINNNKISNKIISNVDNNINRIEDSNNKVIEIDKELISNRDVAKVIKYLDSNEVSNVSVRLIEKILTGKKNGNAGTKYRNIKTKLMNVGILKNNGDSVVADRDVLDCYCVAVSSQ